MGVLYVLIPLALLLGVGAVVAFWWAVRNGQFDDAETPAVRILFEDQRPSSVDEPEIEDSNGKV